MALAPDAIVRLNLGQLWIPYLKIVVPVHGFLVKHPDGAGLVDTGYGTPLELIKDYKPVNASVATAIRQHGVDPADVRWVINSHLHFDHCGQNAVFPDVPIYLQRSEWENRDRYGTPSAWLEYAGARFELLDGETEIVPGVRVVTTPGHTRGHQSISVDTTAGAALITGDACWTVEMFEGKPPRTLMMDDMPTALTSLQQLRDLKPAAVHFCHDKRTWHHAAAPR
ncbi:MAG TPA: N-acyl homoserine lactonase family protein [Candidatus Dormibacteraeota bacterium]|nr:N-acyl homoserine lactonase family protein [Candidatus Dormibacteraeota bacterium]